MTIYFVDEDYLKFVAFIIELEYRGYKVAPISDAGRAFETLSTASDIELAVVDIMLAGTPGDTHFGEDRTDGFLTTGLILVEDLSKARPDVFPQRCVLFTNASTSAVLGPAKLLHERTGVPVLRKSDYSVREFGDAILGFLRSADSNSRGAGEQ